MDPRPGWSFALLSKFEFWAHVMESVQNAKLHSKAGIGREKGGPLLGGIPLKIDICCMFVVHRVSNNIFVHGVPTQQRTPPPPKCARRRVDLQS